jgi:glycosyltransferase involved in cell wall biosynthesis
MPLTVLQALPALEVGGVERGTVEVATALTAEGHRAMVVSAGGRLVDKLTACGGEHIDLNIGKKSPLTLRHVAGLRALLQQERVDIVHARSRLPAWICWLALRALPAETRPVFITTVHGPYSVNRYSRIMCRGERVIAISGFIREYILNNYPDTNPDRIRVIHRGVDSAEFPFAYRPDAAWLQSWHERRPGVRDRFVITAPARITRWKGQEDFIHIVQGLKQAGVPVHGLIAGGAHPRRQKFLNELVDMVKRFGLDHDISFLGHRDDLKEIMAVSDVVMSLAREPEAFGRTALESLCLGTPVIAYDHGGAAEVLAKMFPAGRIEPMNIQQAIERAGDFYKTPPRMTDNNVFTRQQMLDQTLALYRESVTR